MPLIHRLSCNSGVWNNAAKTIPATNGLAVAVWSPVAGSVTTDATQTTANKQPLYQSNYNATGYPAIVSDGSNDAMTIAYSAPWQATSVTILCAFSLAATWPATAALFTRQLNANWDDGFWLGSYVGSMAGTIHSWSMNNPLLTAGRYLAMIRATHGDYQIATVNARNYGLAGSAGAVIPVNTNPVTLFARTNSDMFIAAGIHHFEYWNENLGLSDLDARSYAISQEYGLGLYSTRASGRPFHPLATPQVIG